MFSLTAPGVVKLKLTIKYSLISFMKLEQFDDTCHLVPYCGSSFDRHIYAYAVTEHRQTPTLPQACTTLRLPEHPWLHLLQSGNTTQIALGSCTTLFSGKLVPFHRHNRLVLGHSFAIDIFFFRYSNRLTSSRVLLF